MYKIRERERSSEMIMPHQGFMQDNILVSHTFFGRRVNVKYEQTAEINCHYSMTLFCGPHFKWASVLRLIQAFCL